jgi:hypothetical protein
MQIEVRIAYEIRCNEWRDVGPSVRQRTPVAGELLVVRVISTILRSFAFPNAGAWIVDELPSKGAHSGFLLLRSGVVLTGQVSRLVRPADLYLVESAGEYAVAYAREVIGAYAITGALPSSIFDAGTIV